LHQINLQPPAPVLESTNSVIPEIQVSTHQVPCGQHSIFDRDYDVTEFERAVYLIINYHSHWDGGYSHALSYRMIADKLGVKHRSQVVRAVKSLIAKGWLSIDRQRLTDGANIYKITHHNCLPEQVPLDADQRPQKCAIPHGEGSAVVLVEEGKLSWRAMVQWFVSKIFSDWRTGIVQMSIRMANDLMSFCMQTICDNAKKLTQIGLFKRLSARNAMSEYQIYPQPYPEKHERQARQWYEKPLPLINGYYYAYNRRWRFSRENLRVQMEDVCGKWRYASMSELLEINPQIHRAFTEYIDRLARMMQDSNLYTTARC